MFKKLLAAITVGGLMALGGLSPVAAQAAVDVSLTASPETITLGDSSTLTLTGLEDTTPVYFAIAEPELNNNQGMLDPEDTAVADGIATTVFTPNAAGTYVIEAGSENFEGILASVTITVLEPLINVFSLTASPETITLGDSSTLTLTGLEDTTPVYFAIAEPELNNNQGMLDPEDTAVADGIATTVFTPNAAGTYVIEAGSENFEGILASVTITVLEPLTNVFSLTASPETITLGESSTLTLTGLEDTTPVYFAIAEPELNNNQGMLDPEDTAVADGIATTVFTPNAAGTYVIEAGSENFEGILASVTITVLEPLTNVFSLTASPDTITLGESSTLTLTGLEDTTPVYFAIAEPELNNNQGMLDPEDTAVADGIATTVFTPNAAGTYVIEAGSENFEGILASVTITVLEPLTNVFSLTASPDTITLGESSTLTLTGLEDTTPVYFAIAEPELNNNQGMLDPEDTAVADGIATTVFTPNAAGTYVIEAGSENFEGILASVTITVLEPDTLPLTNVTALAATGGETPPLALWFGLGALVAGGALLATTMLRRSARRS
ncbi:hypothetical protein ACWPKO_28480 (plasmid) [Coraliomargarita sp. W4R53]